jgi:hypothetical protein
VRRGCVVLVAAVLITELVPMAYGTGEAATVDYGFFYVTMRFILLPIASLALILSAVFGAGRCLWSREYRRAVTLGASALIPVLYLLAAASRPAPWIR